MDCSSVRTRGIGISASEMNQVAWSSLRTQGPIRRGLSSMNGVSVTILRQRWLWVPAFAGTTREIGRSRPRQIEDALGDDSEHHLRGTAFDRVGLGAQPGAWAGAASG